MSKYNLKAFGIVREIVGGRQVVMEINGQTVADVRAHLLTSYPALIGLRSMLIAVNNEYAEDSQVILETDEIALIPPVSGG